MLIDREHPGQKKLPSFEEFLKGLKLLSEHGSIGIPRTYEDSAFKTHRQMLTNYTTNSDETRSEHSPQQIKMMSSPTDCSQSKILTGDEGMGMSESLVGYVQNLSKEKTLIFAYFF